MFKVEGRETMGRSKTREEGVERGRKVWQVGLETQRRPPELTKLPMYPGGLRSHIYVEALSLCTSHYSRLLLSGENMF